MQEPAWFKPQMSLGLVTADMGRELCAYLRQLATADHLWCTHTSYMRLTLNLLLEKDPSLLKLLDMAAQQMALCTQCVEEYVSSMTWLSEQFDVAERGDIQLALENMDAERLSGKFSVIEASAGEESSETRQFMVPEVVVALYEIMLKPALLENENFKTSSFFFQLLSNWKPASSKPIVQPILIAYGIVKALSCVHQQVQRWAQSFQWTEYSAIDFVPIMEHALRLYEVDSTNLAPVPLKQVFHRPPSTHYFDAMVMSFRRFLTLSDPEKLVSQLPMLRRILALVNSRFIPSPYGAKILGVVFDVGDSVWTGEATTGTLAMDILEAVLVPLLQPELLNIVHIAVSTSFITSFIDSLGNFDNKIYARLIDRISDLLKDAHAHSGGKNEYIKQCIKKVVHNCFARKPALPSPLSLKTVWTSLIDPATDAALLKSAMAAEADFMRRCLLNAARPNNQQIYDIFPQRMIVLSVIRSGHLPMLLVKCAPFLLIDTSAKSDVPERTLKFLKAILGEIISAMERETNDQSKRPHAGLGTVLPMVAPYYMVNDGSRSAFLALWTRVLDIREPSVNTTQLLTFAFLGHTAKGLHAMLYEVLMLRYDFCRASWAQIADFATFILNSPTFVTPPDEHLEALSEIREETILLTWLFVKHMVAPEHVAPPRGATDSSAGAHLRIVYRHVEAIPDALRLLSCLLTYYRDNSVLVGAVKKCEKWVPPLLRIPRRLVVEGSGNPSQNVANSQIVSPESYKKVVAMWKSTMGILNKVLVSTGNIKLGEYAKTDLLAAQHLLDLDKWQPLFNTPFATNSNKAASHTAKPASNSSNATPSNVSPYGSSALTSAAAANYLGVSRPGLSSNKSGKPTPMSVTQWMKSAPAGPQSSSAPSSPSKSVTSQPKSAFISSSTPSSSAGPAHVKAPAQRPLPSSAAPKKRVEPPAAPEMTLQQRKEHDAEIQRAQMAKRKREAMSSTQVADTPLHIVSAVQVRNRDGQTNNLRQNHNEARQHRMRSLDELHEKVLQMNFGSLTFPVEDTTVTKHIPNAFRNIEEYVTSFEPLLLLELQTQLQNAKEELVPQVEVKSIRYISELSQFHEATVEKSREWQNGDVFVMWPKDEFGTDFRRVLKDPNAPHCLGILAKDKKKKKQAKGFLSIEQNGYKDVSIRVLLSGNLSDHRKDLFSRFHISSEWCFCNLYSMGTVCREWQALQSVQLLSGVSEILNPSSGDDLHVGSYHPAQLKELVPKLSVERRFNDSQRNAIFESTQRKGFSFIQGPPGTGKTRTLVGLLSLLMALQASPILVCTPSNSAIDEVIGRMLENGLHDMTRSAADAYTKQFRVVRVGRPSENASDSVRGVLLSELKQPIMAARRMTPEEAEQVVLKGADIVCCTLSTSGSGAMVRANIPFKTVIIDEAAQAVELATLIPLQHQCEQCILIGDPQQLPATVFSSMASKYLYERSMFARFTETMASNRVLLLNTQYRMHPQISLFPNKHFYKGLLVDGTKPLNASWSASSTFFSPLRFFDLKKSAMSNHSNSLGNPEEVNFVVGMIRKLVSLNPRVSFQDRIVVITPYQMQRNLLQSAFSKQNEYAGVFSSIGVSTVDSYQGKEKSIVILSTVRAKRGKSIGFLADVRRLNVALTRAQQSLWIVGQSETLEINPEWNALLKSLEERNMITAVDKSAEVWWNSSSS